MSHDTPCNNDYISPVFIRTKFFHKFVRIGVDDANQGHVNERNNRASFQSSSVQNQQGVLKRELYNRSSFQSILSANEKSP
jgi:hypothetical protein